METIFAIRAYISAQPFGALIATRDLLEFGLRNSVDKATSYLVKLLFMRRIARGLFILFDAADPPAEQIAAAKARAFGKEIVTHPDVIAPNMEFPSAPSESRNLYVVKGRSSSFGSVRGRIYLHGAVAKKMRGGDAKLAKITRVLVSRGVESAFIHIEHAFSLLKPAECEKLVRSARWMPCWLSDRVRLAFLFSASADEEAQARAS